MAVTRSCRRTRVAGRALQQHYDVASVVARLCFLLRSSNRNDAPAAGHKRTYTLQNFQGGTGVPGWHPIPCTPADEYSTMRLPKAVTGR